MDEEKLIVGIADMKMTQGSGMLITYALGSCIGICLYDPLIKLASLTHILLPLNMETGRKNTFKYADTGVREVIARMEAAGSNRSRMVAKIAGGARMFEIGPGGIGNIGQRNAESVRMIIQRERIRLVAEHTGGSVARTVLFDGATGQACIRSYGREDIIF